MPHDHFARPIEFGKGDPSECTECGESISLIANPDGHRVWRHNSDVLDDLRDDAWGSDG